jgi:hypothetical protein
MIGGSLCVILIIAAMAWQRRFLAYDAADPQP